jgi:hypothetical protein
MDGMGLGFIWAHEPHPCDKAGTSKGEAIIPDGRKVGKQIIQKG